MLRESILAHFRAVTEEEAQLLAEKSGINQGNYATGKEFVVDSKLLLEKGTLIEIRPHTRFAYFPRHRHNYVELVYMCAGTTTHIINGKTRVVLEEGDMLFLNQNVYHEILPAEENDIAVNFIILPEFFDRPLSMIEKENVLRDFIVSSLTRDASGTNYLHVRSRGIVPVENLIENMLWTLIEHESMVDTINQTSMGLLLMNLSRFADSINRGEPGQTEQKTVLTVLDYIEHHYQSGTLTEAAAGLHLPDYALSRLLKKHTGKTFKELLQLRKLQQAAYLLDNSTLPADRIMEAVGYENSSYFYRSFRAKYGCSPREYRKKDLPAAVRQGEA
ncbi:MAG: AraC family transcriptional regulator [Lachnospiraceae bacterium]|nr:AraC family transcriptional regulator [Lachnospiraceae bacterium]